MEPMPANLTPEYEKAEQRYREAKTDPDKLLALQQMLSTIPKHKGTEKMQADIKRRISQLRKAAGRKAASKGVDLFHVPKTGIGQVVFVGFPNVGKSSIVGAATNAPVKVAEYPHATALPTPGMWPYEDVQMQLVDTPPMTPEHVPPGLVGTIRSADVIAVVVDASADPLAQAGGIWNILAARGLELRSVPRGRLDADRPGQRSSLIVANKADLAGAENIGALRELYADRLEVLPVSAATGEGLDRLARKLWQLLDIIRVYTKAPGQKPDMTDPIVIARGSTLYDAAAAVHKDFAARLKYARIWGSGKHDGIMAKRDHILKDGDIIELHM